MFSALNKFRPLFLLVDLALTMIALFGGEYIRTYVPVFLTPVDATSLPVGLTPEICVSALVAWLLAFQSTGIHSPRALPDLHTWRAIVLADILGTGGFLAIIFFLKVADFSRGVVVYTLGLAIGFHLIRHFLTRFCLGTFLRPFFQRVLIVGEGEIGMELAERVTENNWGMKIVGGIAPHGPLANLPRPGKLIELPDIVQREKIDVVLIALPSERHELILELVFRLQALPVRIDVVPPLLNLTMSRAAVEDFFGLPIVGLREPPIGLWGRILKRSFDVLASLLALIFISPVMLMVMAAVRIYDGGPIFFQQKRVGENGRIFGMLKFRSMVVDAESRLQSVGIDLKSKLDLEKPVLKVKNDPRVTPVGRFIRRWSLDELPQLLNILKGDMSLVGPRPENPKVVAHYTIYQRKCLAVKPGLTGPMQINGRGDLPVRKRMALDLDYIDNWSVWKDLKIILLTIPAVISGRGAY